MEKSLRVEKTVPGDFEDIYPLLLRFNNPHITKQQWQNLFIDHWNLKKGYCGYKMRHGEETVGFIAYILSRKFIRQRWEPFCNISSWIVKPEFRSNSIDLLYPLLELKDHTIISFTPTPGAYKVETKLFKLKVLDGAEVILPVLPKLPLGRKKKLKILTRNRHADDAILQHLTEEEKRIFQDHAAFDSTHVVVLAEQGTLYLILRRVYKRHMPFVKLYYVNHLPLFQNNLEELRFRLPLAVKTCGIVVDSRFLSDKQVPLKKTKSFYLPMLYKSDRLQPHEVDYLYSEFFLLGLR
jgi:hypothetical protein